MTRSREFIDDLHAWMASQGNDVAGLVNRYLVERWLLQATDGDRELAREIIEQSRFSELLKNEIPADLDRLGCRYEFHIDESSVGDFITPSVLAPLFEERQEGRRNSGTFFTSSPVAEFMALQLTSQLPLFPEGFVLDPACGVGDLLMAMFRQWVDAARVQGIFTDTKLRAFLHRRLCGVERNPSAAEMCRMRLWLFAVASANDPLRLAAGATAIVTGDSLAARPTNESSDWRTWFPLAFEAGGFDAIIANPPYVRVERWEDRSVQSRFPEVCSRRADLYSCFFVVANELLNGQGAAVLITSNSWLDAHSGAALQHYLLANTRLLAVTETQPVGAFANAEINAAVTLFRSTSEANPNDSTRFYSLSDSWSLASTYQLHERSRSELLQTCGDSASPVSGKWGGRFLRAPDVYHDLVNSSSALVELSEVAEVRGYIHDNDTGHDFPQHPFVKSIRHLRRIAIEKDDSAVTDFGVKDSPNARTVAPILFARTFGTRHLIAFNQAGVLAKEFYKILPHADVDAWLVCAQLNSTWGILQREILGISNLGEGGLKFSLHDLRQFLLIPEFSSDEMSEIRQVFTRFAKREQLDLPEELEQSDRRELDQILLEKMGLPNERLGEIYEVTGAIVERRRSRGNWGRQT